MAKKYKKVYIEITNICNLKCNFCPETKRDKRYMKKEEFTHVIHQIKPFSDYVYFHLMGEPLMNSEIGDFLSTCGDNFLKVNITTNGVLLKAKKNILLEASALRKVSVSLHSFEANKETMKLENYLDETICFVKEAALRGIICELRLWNADSEDIKGSNRLNAEIISKLEREFKPECSLTTEIGQRSNVKLGNNLFLQMAQKFEWPDLETDIIDENAFCYGLRDQFGVLVDGTVVPCCLDNDGNIPLGNIFEQPLEEILESQRAKNIYDGFTARTAVEELCKKCGYAGRHKR